jgi:predicted transcriptional regulator
MTNDTPEIMKFDSRERLAVLSSPLRLEILGLFTNHEPLAITDMAALMQRAAGSLYHHVGLLEKAGLLKRTGTRPKGKRFEALFFPTATIFEAEAPTGDEDAVAHAVKTMASGFRMAERDLEAALQSGDMVTEGSDRNLLAARIHMRLSPDNLAKLNGHLKALEDFLLSADGAATPRTPDDQHMSLTIAFLPIKGRGKHKPEKS